MNQQELAQVLSDLSDQLAKALDEIVAEIQAAGEVTPEVQAAVDRAKAAAQALDDLNPELKPFLGSDYFVVEDRGNFRKWCRLHGREEAENLIDVYVRNRSQVNWLKSIMPDYLEVIRQ